MQRILILLAALGLAGCVTRPNFGASAAGALELATTAAPGDLRGAATAGEARAQLALSIGLTYGLNGSPPAPTEARIWRDKATVQRGTTTLPTYIAPAGGSSGQVNLIPVAQYDVTWLDVVAAYQCAEWLKLTDSPSSAATKACGGRAEFTRLKVLWARAAGFSDPDPGDR